MIVIGVDQASFPFAASTSPPPKRPRSGREKAMRVQEIIARECLRGNSTIVDPTCRDELFQDAA